MCKDAFWGRSDFVVVENSEVKPAHSGVIPGWMTFGEASRQAAPESKTVRGDSRIGQYLNSVGPGLCQFSIRACLRPEVCRRGRRTLRGVD